MDGSDESLSASPLKSHLPVQLKSSNLWRANDENNNKNELKEFKNKFSFLKKVFQTDESNSRKLKFVNQSLKVT
jgi:hypothetical protein